MKLRIPAGGRFPCSLVFLLVFWLAAWTNAVELRVQVLAAADHTPLTNVNVTVKAGTNVLTTAGPTVSPVTLQVTPVSETLQITASAPGHAPMRTGLQLAGTSQTNIILVLPKAQTIGGVVLEDDGLHPVAGVQIFLNFPRSFIGPAVPVDELPLVTDAAGRWQCDWLPADVSLIRVQARHSEYEVAADAGLTLDNLRSGTAQVQLRPVMGLRGQVLDPAGNPVVDATVVYGPGEMLFGVEGNFATHTDAQGHFRFSNLAKGTYSLGAYFKAWAPVAQTVEVQPKLPPVTLKLAPPHMVAAQIVDPQGQPISGVTVVWDEAGIFRYPGWRGVTDATGRFEITNAPATEISVDLSRADYMSAAFIRLQPDVSNQTFTLLPVMHFRGQVLEAASGKPVAAFKVIPGAWQPGTDYASAHFSGNEYQAQPFEQGELDYRLDRADFGLNQGGPGVMLQIIAAGYQTEVVGPFTNNVTGLVVRLHPPVPIQWQILTPEGKPAAGAELRLGNTRLVFFVKNGRFQPMSPSLQLFMTNVTADTQGVIAVAQIPEFGHAVVLHESGYLTFAPVNTNQVTELRLIPWAKLSGTVRSRGKILTNRLVAVVVPYATSDPLHPKVWYPQALANQQTTTDSAGQFNFDRLPAGDLTVVLPDSAAATPAFGRLPYQQPLEVVRLEAGQVATVELESVGTDVAGHLVWPPNLPSNVNWHDALLTLSRSLPTLDLPPNLDVPARKEWLEHWFYSEAGRSWRPWVSVRTGIGGSQGELAPESRSVAVRPDGSFVCAGLPAGEFELHIRLSQAAPVPNELPRTWDQTTVQFRVPENAGAHFDLGAVGWTNLTPTAPPPTPREPFTVGLAMDASAISPRATVQLRLWVRVAPGHHIYGFGEDSQTYAPVSLTLHLPEGWQATGNWSGPEAHLQDGHQVLAGDLMFSRQIESPAALPATAHFTCEVRAQACNDQFCWPPATHNAEITLNLKP